MTILISIFGFAARAAGDLLSSALGWASSLLFGRVPKSHQIYLTLMMAGSFLWLLMLVGLVVPSAGSFFLATTPHPASITSVLLNLVFLLGVIFLPLGVGLAGFLVPAEGDRPKGAAIVVELLRGYVLTPLIAGLLLFLASVGIARKVRSQKNGWSDAHVPIVVKPGGYDQMVVDLRDALARVDLTVVEEDAPRVLTVPAWLLTQAAGPNVRKLRPDRLVDLDGPNLQIGLYPSDIAISGATHERTRARAAILSRLATTSAYMTTSAEAQRIEDELTELARPDGPARSMPRAWASAAFQAIDAKLLDLEVPSDEWDILYRERLQVERDLLAGAKPGTPFPGHAPESQAVARPEDARAEPARQGPAPSPAVPVSPAAPASAALPASPAVPGGARSLGAGARRGPTGETAVSP